MKGIQQTMNAEIIMYQATSIKILHKWLMVTFVSCCNVISLNSVGVNIRGLAETDMRIRWFDIREKWLLSLCTKFRCFCPFSFGHCVGYPSNYRFWLPLWYLQTLLRARYSPPMLKLSSIHYTVRPFLHINYERKFKQWYSISTKRTISSHLNSFTTTRGPQHMIIMKCKQGESLVIYIYLHFRSYHLTEKEDLSPYF